MGLAGCGGADTLTRTFDRDEQVLALLEANKADPAKAGEAVAAYVKEHEQELAALKTEVQALRADPTKMRELLAKHEERLAAIMARRQKLQKDAPELFTDPKVQAALGAGM